MLWDGAQMYVFSKGEHSITTLIIDLFNVRSAVR